jgi:flagellar motility protein MotE (MotC chaperone)
LKIGEQMEQKEKSSKLVWFLLVIVIPGIFAITVFSIVLSFMGVNVIEEAKNTGKKIPVVKDLLDDPPAEKEDSNKKKEEQWASKFQEQEDYIKLLTSDLQKKEEEVVSLKGDVALLKKQVEEAETQAEKEENEKLKKLYEAMSAKDAAAVMTEMKNSEALNILTLLQAETQAAILAKLEAKRAAELTILMAQGPQ